MDYSVSDVINLFVVQVLDEINGEKELPKIFFSFSKEALSYISRVLENPNLIDLLDVYKENAKYQIDVKNYHKFFTYLTDFCNETFKNKLFYSFAPEYLQRQHLLLRIWLRMTPSDLQDVERFLKEQVDFVKDKTFEKYKLETPIGQYQDYFITAEKKDSASWDECNYEMQIRLCNQDKFHTLPLIRYDIKDTGKEKICMIGAIQNKTGFNHLKKVDRLLFKLNKDVLKEETNEYLDFKNNKLGYYPENISDIYPGSLLSLIIFINMLIKEGITKIKVPCMHIFSYEYHEILAEDIKQEFDHNWKNIYEMDIADWELDNYNYEKEVYKHMVEKEDFISRAKTEELLRIFRRLVYHYPFIDIINEPFIEGDYLLLKIQSKNIKNIRPEIVSDIYDSMSKYKVYKRF